MTAPHPRNGPHVSFESYRETVLDHLARALEAPRPAQYVPFDGMEVMGVVMGAILAINNCEAVELGVLSKTLTDAGIRGMQRKAVIGAQPRRVKQPRPFRLIDGGAR